MNWDLIAIIVAAMTSLATLVTVVIMRWSMVHDVQKIISDKLLEKIGKEH
jgi:hypothetical protein